MPNSKQEKDFQSLMLDHIIADIGLSSLSDAIDFIGNNIEPEDVYDIKTLETWAEKNGYIKE